ncbi:MAG: hypothetical protein I8H75_05880 [Myxococcaceae bacterium]|nr:hypothetical protein [Myxococcaceae bacterium]MBH2006844.1 hypothetical protein [Myxococcaceae bacterium]
MHPSLLSSLFYVILILLSVELQAEKCQEFSSQSVEDFYADDAIYDQVTWLAAHNAFTNVEDGWSPKAVFPSGQQTLGFDAQFEYGVRAFFIDLHWCRNKNDELYLAMAHEHKKSLNEYDYRNPLNHKYLRSCDSSPIQRNAENKFNIPAFESFLSKLKRWLDANSMAIVTLHLESSTGTTGNQILIELLTSANLLNFIYSKNLSDPWPTLGEMRKSNKRLVIFSDNKHDGFFHTTAYRETEYDLSDFRKCEMRLDDRNTDKTSTLLVMNHFHVTSHENAECSFNEVNNPNFIKTRSDQCYQQEGIHPAFIVCDHIEQGDRGGCREAVLTLNALRLQEACFDAKVDPYLISKENSQPFESKQENCCIGGLGLAISPTVCLLLLTQQRPLNPPLLELKTCLKLMTPLGLYYWRLVPETLQTIASHLESPVFKAISLMQHYGHLFVPLQVGLYALNGWYSPQSKQHAVLSLLLATSSTSLLLNGLIFRYVNSGWIPSLSIAAFVPLCTFLYYMPTWIHRAFQP